MTAGEAEIEGVRLASGFRRFGNDAEMKQHSVGAHECTSVVPPALSRRHFPGPARIGEGLDVGNVEKVQRTTGLDQQPTDRLQSSSLRLKLREPYCHGCFTEPDHVGLNL